MINPRIIQQNFQMNLSDNISYRYNNSMGQYELRPQAHYPAIDINRRREDAHLLSTMRSDPIIPQSLTLPNTYRRSDDDDSRYRW